MAEFYKDKAGHFTNKENDGGECHHKLKRISGGKYEYSEDGGSNWSPFEKQEDYDKYEAESEEFDATNDDDFGDFDSDDGVESVINEMKKEGVNVSQESEVAQYLGATLGLDRDDQGDILSYMEENGYFPEEEPEEENDDIEIDADKAIEARKQEEREKLDKKFPRKGDEKLEKEVDNILDKEAEVIGGNDNNEGMLKDKTPLSEEESNKFYSPSKIEDFTRQYLKKQGLSDEFIEKTIKRMRDNWNVADYFEELMKQGK